MYIVQEIKER